MEKYLEQALQSEVTSEECKLCSVKLMSASITNQHCASKRHKNNVALFLEVAKQVFLSSCMNQQDLQGNRQKKDEKHVTENVPKVTQDLYCKACSVQTGSREQMWNHLKKTTHHVRAKELGHPQINGINTPFNTNLPKELKDQMLVDICHICSNSFSTVSQALDHYGNPKHDTAVRRWFKEKLQAKKSTKNSVTKPESSEIKQESKMTERFYCYPCKIFVDSKPEKDRHVQNFPHVLLVKLKSVLLKEGIVDEYWSLHGSIVECLLCDRRMCVSSDMTSHSNSIKHIHNYNHWCESLQPRKVAVDVRWYYCKICNQDLDGTSESERHYCSSSHSKKSQLYCYICKVSNATPTLLEAHKSSSLHMGMLQKSQNPIAICEHSGQQTGRCDSSIKSSDSGINETECNLEALNTDPSLTPKQYKENTNNMTTDLKSLGNNYKTVSSQQILENAINSPTDASINSNPKSIDKSSTSSSASTLYRSEKNSNTADSKSLEMSLENSSTSSNTKKLKEQVFNELELLVQKLYYSKTVPYEVALNYLKRINREVEELSKKSSFVNTADVPKQHTFDFNENIDMRRKESALIPEESCDYTGQAENERTDKCIEKDHLQPAQLRPTSKIVHDLDQPNHENFISAASGYGNYDHNDKTEIVKWNDSVTTIDTENGDKNEAHNISDLIRTVMERKRELEQDDPNDHSIEKEVLNEMEIFLRQIEDGGIPLEEILNYLEKVNRELQTKEFGDHGEVPTGEDEKRQNSAGQVRPKYSEELLTMRTCENVNLELRVVVNDTSLSHLHLKDSSLTDFQGSNIDLYYNYYFDNNFKLFRKFLDVYLQGSSDDWLNIESKA